MGHLGCKDPEKRVPGTGFYHITSLYNRRVEQKKNLSSFNREVMYLKFLKTVDASE